jgi:Ferritin-like domain
VRAELRRRSVLAAGAAAVPWLAAGCKGVGALGTPPTPLPEVAVLRGAISGEQVMISRYRSALGGLPSLRTTLTPVLGQHLDHLAALRARLIEPPGTATPSRPAREYPAAPQGSQAAALDELAAAESAAAASLASRLAAVSPALAQLLASVAASEASHAALLRQGPR